jgi:hypothetical protein
MNLPGFSAEASLYKTRHSYRGIGAYSRSESRYEPARRVDVRTPLSAIRDFILMMSQRWLCENDCWIKYREQIQCDTRCAFHEDPPYCQCLCHKLYAECIAGCYGLPPPSLPQCCPTGRTPCGEECCARTEICRDGRCVPVCDPGDIPCPVPGSDPPTIACCSEGYKCCEEQGCCCPTERTCCGQYFADEWVRVCCPNNYHCCKDSQALRRPAVCCPNSQPYCCTGSDGVFCLSEPHSTLPCRRQRRFCELPTVAIAPVTQLLRQLAA